MSDQPKQPLVGQTGRVVMCPSCYFAMRFSFERLQWDCRMCVRRLNFEDLDRRGRWRRRLDRVLGMVEGW